MMILGSRKMQNNNMSNMIPKFKNTLKYVRRLFLSIKRLQNLPLSSPYLSQGKYPKARKFLPCPALSLQNKGSLPFPLLSLSPPGSA